MSIPQGRCAGCGDVRALKDSEWHITWCPGFARLYQAAGAPVLGPAQELARWQDQDRAREHAAGLAQRTADTVASRAASRARFASVDLLEGPDDVDRPVGGAVRQP